VDLGLRERLDRFWAARLGCPEGWLHEGVHVLPLEQQPGVYVVATDSAVVVSSAPACAADLDRVVRERPDHLLEPGTLRDLLGVSLDRTIGPAWVGYTTAPARAPLAVGQRLDRPGPRDLADLHTEVSDEEWQHAGAASWSASVGLFSARGLLAAAGYQVQEATVAHIGVVTRRTQRAAGCGRRVVSAIASEAVATGLIPQYQTLEANAPSLRVGAVLGFERYARTLAARLKEEGT
jgi:GNAT superfamily N-acetyltransferase